MATNADKKLLSQTNQLQKERLLKVASNASVLVAVLLVFIKAFAWFKTDSVAMFGSLLDSILDTLASLINLYFIRSAMKPADTKHRFGHGKAEPLGGILQAMIIGGSAMFLIAESIRRFATPALPDNSALGISMMLLSSAMVMALVVLQRYVVKRTGSIVVAGDALHGFGDIVINLGVILALVISAQFNTPIIDPIIAIALAGILIRGAWSIGNEAIGQLMDAEFSYEERIHIRSLALQHSEVTDIHDLRTRSAGITAFIQMHIEMDGSITLSQAHRIADEVEQIIRKEYPHTEVLIHQDPQGSENIDSFLRS